MTRALNCRFLLRFKVSAFNCRKEEPEITTRCVKSTTSCCALSLGLVVFSYFYTQCLSLDRLWWNEQCVCVEEESSALAGFIQPPP